MRCHLSNYRSKSPSKIQDHTLAMSHCYGKVPELFVPRDTSLVSARNSHSSGIRGVVVGRLLFNPESSSSNRVVCANFLEAFGTRRFPLVSELWDYPPFWLCDVFWNFLNVPKVFTTFNCFDIYNRMNVKKSRRVPSFWFSVTMRLFKIPLFVFFSRNFCKVSKGPGLKGSNLKGCPFTVFGIVRFSKLTVFVSN